MQPIARCTRCDPSGILPLMFVNISDDGCIVRPLFSCESVRIGLQSPRTADARSNFEFVDGALTETGDEDFPDAGFAAKAHWMDATVPEIEIADDADAQRVRRPYPEVDAANARHLADVRAQLFVFLVVRSFARKVKIVIGEQGRKCIGVQSIERVAVGELEMQTISGGRDVLIFAQPRYFRRKNGFENAERMNLMRRNFRRHVQSAANGSAGCASLPGNRCLRCPGPVCADCQDAMAVAVNPVRSEKVERVRNFGANDSLDLVSIRVAGFLGFGGHG